MYRLSAPIWTFCRYIGFADKAIAYRFGYRYRPIWYLISVHNQIALLQSYDTNLTRKIWKNSSKWDFALLTEFVKKIFRYSFSFSPSWCAKKEEKLHQISFSTYRYRLSVSADKKKIISVLYRYRPIQKLNISVLISIGR